MKKQVMNHFGRFLFVTLLFLLFLKQQAAAQLFTPVVDAQVENFVDEPSVLVEDSFSINTQYIELAGIDRRGVLEYDASAIPANAVIRDASIIFHVNGFTSNDADDGPNVRIYAYAGNGMAEIADANDDFSIVATAPDVVDTGYFEVPLEVQPIQAALDQGTGFIGFQLRGSLDWNDLSFAAIDFPTSNPPPPATLFLSVSAYALGDTNLDNAVNFLDISPFIAILTSNSFLAQADCNQDGEVTFLDIAPFIQILGGN